MVGKRSRTGQSPARKEDVMADNREVSLDQLLVDRCLGGETAAWTELFEHHWTPLFNHLRSRLCTRTNVDSLVWEIADDVWLSLSYPRSDRLRAYDSRRGSLDTFLRALADDQLRKTRRKQRQKKELHYESLQVDPPAPQDSDLETQELLERFVATLPPPYLDFCLHELLGVPAPEDWQRPRNDHCRVLKHRIYLLYKDFCRLLG
jgi:DNA-directed RNA polymerase specialized sigma24 family protein